MTPLEAASKIVGLEENAIPEWTVMLVGYIDEEGGQRATAWMTQEMTFRDVIWAIEELKHRLLTASNSLE